MKPTFTVIIPAYNAADTIESAVGSVLAQTRGDFEVIIVDDGSSDDTAERAAALQDPRIAVIRQENAGSSAALNTGITHSRGQYVSRLDADDLYLPNYLQEMERALAAAPRAGFAYTDAWILDVSSSRIQRTTAMSSERPPSPPPSEPSQFLAELLERNFVFTAATIRRSALEDVGPFNTSLRNGQDYEMWLRLAAHGLHGVRAEGTLAVYRRAPGTLSADLLGMATARREIYRLVAEEYPVPASVRRLAGRRMLDSEAEINAVRASRARRRWVPRPLRRLLGRGYRALRNRGSWYREPPREIAIAFPDLRRD